MCVSQSAVSEEEVDPGDCGLVTTCIWLGVNPGDYVHVTLVV